MGSGSNDVTDLNLTLDDEAGGRLPDATALTSGRFQPSDYSFGQVDTYAGDAPTLNGNTSLSGFDGTSPNGRWRLFFVDDELSDVSTITGWSRDLSSSETQSPLGSITFNAGAATTAARDVSLGLDAVDPAPSGVTTQMRFNNDGSTFSRSSRTPPRPPGSSAPAAGAKAEKVSATVLAKATKPLAADTVTDKPVFHAAKDSTHDVRPRLACGTTRRTGWWSRGCAISLPRPGTRSLPGWVPRPCVTSSQPTEIPRPWGLHQTATGSTRHRQGGEGDSRNCSPRGATRHSREENSCTPI